jgi:hypothetical protein
MALEEEASQRSRPVHDSESQEAAQGEQERNGLHLWWEEMDESACRKNNLSGQD